MVSRRRLLVSAAVLVTAVLAALILGTQSAKADHVHDDAWRTQLAKERKRTTAMRKQLRRSRVTAKRFRQSTRNSVDSALNLCSQIFGVPLWEMRTVALKESTFRPHATNGRFLGLFQLGSEVRVFRGDYFDPYVNACAAAKVVSREGGWFRWQAGPRGAFVR